MGYAGRLGYVDRFGCDGRLRCVDRLGYTGRLWFVGMGAGHAVATVI